MKGNLYIVTNDINNKIYIGKTYTSLDTRWKRHINDAFRKDKDNNYKLEYKFYRAIRKYGPEHFKIKLISEFEQDILEQKEIEYIAKYDSYNNGYNSTLGGEGKLTREIDEQLVLDLYNNGVSISTIRLELGLGSHRRLSKIIKDAGIDINRQTKTKVEQYSLDGRLLNVFDSKMDAWKWLVDNYRDNMKRNTAYYYIKQASEGYQEQAFGYKWKQYNTDVIVDNSGCTQYAYYCNAYDNTGKLIFKNQPVIDVAKELIKLKLVDNDRLRTVHTTIIDHDKNHIYGFYWEIYKEKRYE